MFNFRSESSPSFLYVPFSVAHTHRLPSMPDCAEVISTPLNITFTPEKGVYNNVLKLLLEKL
jgi:hypothetical protein